ncbi:MAG: chorismate lyase [Thiotrichales bacterium]|nr:chorismate lyase [Thiotrichales bacterium]MBT3614077.1 chorismate lyase [Thiotrichales bacterium]MBT3752109.1 chorismate lyase [Thiotrichales bacterium]MBT3837532.1 chorismate lyase [Thiotrichales bacterium]MBT4152456.1 chorismate lyase [Thiotrichales bacterium]
MKNFGGEPVWVSHSRLALLAPTAEIKKELLDPSSLTKKIVRLCKEQCDQNFQVRVVAQNFSVPTRSESFKLNFKQGEVANIRSVLLMCGESPWIFARTVIPTKSLNRSLRRLTQLGSRSLGDILHRSRVMERGEVEFCKLNRAHTLFQEILKSGQIKIKVDSLWARRILYRIDGDPLLVIEIILPKYNRPKD